MSKVSFRPSKPKAIQLIPISGIGEIKKGENVGEILLQACKKLKLRVYDNDIIVVTHKIISKAEGRVIDLETVSPSSFARKAGKHIGKDPRQVDVILSETRRLVKMVRGLIIAETSHGFVCANAGVDQSNVERGKVVLLPKNPDLSAARIRKIFSKRIRRKIAVIISDTFGRPWREGQVDVAVGLSGIEPFIDYRGITDQYGYELNATVICSTDELASAAELCMKKLDRIPAVIIRGFDYKFAERSARTIARRPSRDLFR